MCPAHAGGLSCVASLGVHGHLAFRDPIRAQPPPTESPTVSLIFLPLCPRCPPAGFPTVPPLLSLSVSAELWLASRAVHSGLDHVFLESWFCSVQWWLLGLSQSSSSPVLCEIRDLGLCALPCLLNPWTLQWPAGLVSTLGPTWRCPGVSPPVALAPCHPVLCPSQAMCRSHHISRCPFPAWPQGYRGLRRLPPDPWGSFPTKGPS